MKRLPEYDVYELPVEDIFIEEGFNSRGEFLIQSIQSLAQSIRDDGLLHPIIVEPVAGKWRIIAGHRRFKATLYLKQPVIKSSIREGLTRRQAAILNLVENLERTDLNILEEAKAIQRLYPDGVSIRQASNELHKPNRWVHVRQRLLSMPEVVQQQAAAGRLSAANLEDMAGKEPDDQIKMCWKIIDDKEHGYNLTDDCKGTFKQRKRKTEMNDMLSRMLELGIRGLGPRGIAWCAGHISTEEFNSDIERHVKHGLQSRSKKYMRQ